MMYDTTTHPLRHIRAQSGKFTDPSKADSYKKPLLKASPQITQKL